MAVDPQNLSEFGLRLETNRIEWDRIGSDLSVSSNTWLKMRRKFRFCCLKLLKPNPFINLKNLPALMVLLAVGVVFVPLQSSHFVVGLYQRYFLCLGVLSSLLLSHTHMKIHIHRKVCVRSFGFPVAIECRVH